MEAKQDNDDPEQIDGDAQGNVEEFTVEESHALGDALQRIYDRDALAREKLQWLERDR
jgi:hypothetical protein